MKSYRSVIKTVKDADYQGSDNENSRRKKNKTKKQLKNLTFKDHIDILCCNTSYKLHGF